MKKILIVEDDLVIKKELFDLLRANGYLPVETPPCDLALLDVNLPNQSGYDICMQLRKTSNLPIIFLTGRDSAADELLAFSVGADDFIRKPYHSAVLLARIARLLKNDTNDCLSANGLTLHLSNLTAEYEESSVVLTKNEAHILACLMKKDLCTKEEIIEELWRSKSYLDENTLYVNISRLREKLKQLGMEHCIHTVRGVGYRL